ncbi:acyl-CoA Delta-9 desaturase-like, partial [Oppia nitens]|uniref:acyl-CoA Delta-9 desaturase-like n=1 Tax=Oppia nitens TaxID=1686743 RepID=UPI0023DAF9F9
KLQIVWPNVIIMIALHIATIVGYWQMVNGSAKRLSGVFFFLVAIMSSFGILAGAHRLWSHRAYRAKWPLRALLAALQTMALQNSIYEWSRDHRVHHRYSETDADPHNAKRGFFFAHMGWLLCRKHPDVQQKGKLVDMSDLWSDPIVRFQKQYYIPLVAIFWFVIPVSLPIYYLGETWQNSILLNCFRYVLSLQNTWLVNSLAHMKGYQPYDRHISPRENHTVTYLSLGEGYHNYHHTFPWDYSASELGWKDNFNPATAFIDFFAWIGWAYDRKTPSPTVVNMRMARTGGYSRLQCRLSLSSLSILLDFILGLLWITWPLWTANLLNYILY